MSTVEELESRIEKLESALQKNLSLFGRSYAQYGNTNSDFLIKTKGQVKIQWGNKFIDLIKDGKINVDSSFIFSSTSKDKIGVKDGLYVLNSGEVYLKIGGQEPIPLAGEVGTTYVSFLEGQETPADSKYNALRNIGFIYPDINSLGEYSLQNGIIYIESEQKLYIVQNGQLSEFGVSLPSPFTEQFVIQKNNDAKGALLIKGEGISNSVAFDSLYIFTEEGNAYLQADGEINIIIGENTCLSVTRNKTIIKNTVETNTLQSIGATQDSGFMLYQNREGATLIVDNLVVRNPKNSIQTSIYPTYWSLSHNVITDINFSTDETLGNGYIISLKYSNQYKAGDYLYIYDDISSDSGVDIKRILVKVKPYDTEDEEGEKNVIYVEVQESLNDDEPELPNCIDKLTFLVGSEEKLQLLRYSQTSLDLLEYQNIEEEQSLNSIQARFGVLDELQMSERDNVLGVELPIGGVGYYSRQGYFSKAGYEKNYKLEEEDDSTKMASTEWVRKLLKNSLPKGTIIAYHGDDIPKGWALCNGENGTPNLIGKFIKAGTQELEGGNSELLLEESNIPILNTSAKISTVPGSLAGKLIPMADSLEEIGIDQTGTNGYCLSTRKKDEESGFTTLPIEDLSTILDLSLSVGSQLDTQIPIKIEPKYYQLVFIMKIE